MFTSVRHSFASLIDKKLSRKATLMFQDVLLFEFVKQTYLILIYFHLNQLRNVPAKSYLSGKRQFALSQRREGNRFFSGCLSNQSQCAGHDLKTSSVTWYMYISFSSSCFIQYNVTLLIYEAISRPKDRFPSRSSDFFPRFQLNVL